MTDTTLDREVALKVLHTILSADPNFVSRFRTEAKAIANLRHPNIVGIYELGEDDGRQFIAMELMPGGTLNDRLVASGAFAFADALAVLRHVYEGMNDPILWKTIQNDLPALSAAVQRLLHEL